MADCSKNKNPLVRNGTNRVQRFLPALDDKFVVPDENQVENWLVYARNLAAHIKYYSIENKKENKNWQPFFDADVSAQLALMAVQDVDDFKERIRSLLDSLLSTQLQGDIQQLHKNFGLLFSAIISLAYRMDYFAKVLPEDITLRRTINNLALTKLGSSLKRLLGYYKAAVDFYTPALVEDEEIEGWAILAFKQIKLSEIITIIKSQLGSKWIYKSTAANFNDYFTNDIPVDKTIYNYVAANIPNADVWGVVNHAANHNLLTSIFAEFLSAYAKIVTDARQQLLKTITEQNTHEPHYALYLTFLHLFKVAQKDINTYTQRHLDFYYKEVLRLTPRESEPNHVHLILELANNINEHLIKKDTAFKAGKDSEGKDVVYTNDQDVIINKAKVMELRSFYRASSLDKIGVESQEGLLFASPVAASDDGLGAKLTTESGDWHPFANKIFVDGNLNMINMPSANIGFAIASHYLFLKEGKRTITITLKGQSLNQLSGKQFACYITAEKKWEEKTCSISASSGQAVITINIEPADPPVTVFVQKVHGDTFRNVDTPVIKFVLKNEKGNDQYDALKDVTISSVEVKVKVGDLEKYATSGIKELLVSSDQGSVDPSKPFLPFGQNPKAGAGLVIGNKELFSKKDAKVTVSVSWADMDLTIQDMDSNLVDIFFPTAQVKFLESGVWTDGNFKSLMNAEHIGAAKNGEVELFWGKDSVMIPDVYLPSDSVEIPDETIVDYREEYTPYGISSQRGFMKLQLNHDFQFDEYFMALQLYLIGVANKSIDPANVDPPVEPYTPKIQSVYISYEASTTVNFNSLGETTPRFIHLYPFGHDEQDASDVVSGKVNLMPQFTHHESFVEHANAGEFYVGLQDVVPEQKVEILFKILDGSTNPLQSKPEKHVFWSYLSNNHWIDYDPNDVNDGTRQLIETGIISFPFFDDATNDNTLLPEGYYWIKASIKEMPEQVCRLIDVKAQALQATFFDQQNAEDFLKQPLAAGAISKLKEPDSAVKKVEQPYASFGGRYKEDAKNFYTRVSERLRHKNRAITIRDFEQLVLEGFPDIHKVKCLNHTRLELKATETIYNEQAAGHVTVITIPDLRKKNAINPLRPYTSRSRLETIKEYLFERSNCNANLYVENPAFEEIRIKTEIVLRDEFAGNDAFYSEQLKQDLVAFLTPWAYDVNTDINFGGRITKSVIINFIEERNYVDFILKLEMFHNKMDGTPESGDQDEIMASTARSVLVSAAASKHLVTIVPKPQKPDESECD